MNSIFRNKSIDRISSPEQLNDYIRVANPSVRILLTAIFVLLIGICVWSFWGHLDTKVSGAAACDSGTLTCYVSDADIDKIQVGMEIDIDGKVYTVSSVGNAPTKAGDTLSDYLMYLGDFNENDWLYSVVAAADLPDGDYKAEITTEKIKPITFVIN